MSYTITDKNGTLYTFPAIFSLEKCADEINTNVTNTAYTAGGRDIADGFLLPKILTFSGNLQADTSALFEAAKRALVSACLKGGDLRFTDDVVNRYIEVKCKAIDWGVPEGPESGSIQFQEFSITFKADKCFWKDDTETEDDNIVAGNDTLTIPTTGTDYLIKPVIQIDADQAADVPGVKLTNNSDAGMSFTYNDPNFSSGDVLVIDCATGSVMRNNNDTAEYFDGAFLRLQPGNNTIEYEGAACTITFKFRKVYL